MSIEQYGLFKDDKQEAKHQEMLIAEPLHKQPYLSFLPGVNNQEAHIDLNDIFELNKRSLQCSACRLREGCKQVVFGDG